MQSTIAQHQHKKRKSHLSYIACADWTGFDGKAAETIADASNFSPQRNLRLPEKKMFRANPNVQNRIHDVAVPMQSTNNDLQNYLQNRTPVLENKYPSRSLGAAIPLRSAQTEWQNTKELQHTTVEHIALMHQCTKYLNTCKAQ